ncbi:hypothetical protein ACFYRY_17610 [Streptomyces sp. NPDC005263]|uniref:hypothetical protein n=1 Tax=Streptomyces sp. NPDC005263 TaxID=3364711 RepID=UPI00368550DA
MKTTDGAGSMIEIFNLLVDVWTEAFSWFVYPIRVPLLILAAIVVLWLVLRHVVPRAGGTADWTGTKLSALVATVLLAPEYACTLLILRQGRGIPLVLRMYGQWAENVSDWTKTAGQSLGRGMRACTRVSFKAVTAVMLVYLVGYNVHAIGSAEHPASQDAPVVVWWDSLQVWVDAPEHPLLEDGGTPAARPAGFRHPLTA